MIKSLTQRLYALSMSALVTLAMVGGISELFLGEGHAAQMAHSQPAVVAPATQA